MNMLSKGRGKKWNKWMKTDDYRFMPDIHTSTGNRGELFCVLSWELKVRLKSISDKNTVAVYLLFCYFHSFKVTRMQETKSLELQFFSGTSIFLRSEGWQVWLQHFFWGHFVEMAFKLHASQNVILYCQLTLTQDTFAHIVLVIKCQL